MLIHCPLHQDDSASCSVDVDKGVWHCFGCRRSGTLYELARACGLPIAKAIDQEEVLKALHERADRDGGGHAFLLPTRIVHDDEQIAQMWKAAQPSQFGLGYALFRGISAGVLTSMGVDYENGLILFRDCVHAGHLLSSFVGQIREAYPGGRYFSPTSLGPARRPRVLFMFGDALRLILVEGPLDALAVVEAVGIKELEEQNVSVGAICGVIIPQYVRYHLGTWSLFDHDDTGDFYRKEMPWATPLDYPEDDPAAALTGRLGRVKLREAILNALWRRE